MLLVCPSCGASNRVPDARLNEQPVCGKCATELMAAEPVAVSDALFRKFIAGTQLPVLVDFWAPWCGPCQQMAPHFAQAAQQLPMVRFAKVDSDQAPQTSAEYRIRSIPTMILFVRGREVARRSGAIGAGDIVAWVRESLAESRHDA